MGGSESKTVVNQLSEAITNVAMSTVQECEVSATQDQSIVVNNTGLKLWGTYTLEQKSEIRSDCFSDTKKQAELQNKLIQAIAQSSTAEGVGLLGAFGASKSAAEGNLTNIVRNNVTMSNIQKSYNDIKQKQSATFNNSGIVGFEQAELTQGSKLFAAATLQEVDKAGVFNQIENYVDQKSTAKTENPLDFIAKALGAVSSSVMFAIVFFVVIISVVVLGAVTVLRAPAGSPAVAAARY